jgi:hypothetical protein
MRKRIFRLFTLPHHAVRAQRKGFIWGPYYQGISRYICGTLVYCFALMGAYRARQFVSGKAPFAGNSGALAKSGNAAGRELASSLRASRQEAVRGVAFPRNRPTMASKIRPAVNHQATR